MKHHFSRTAHRAILFTFLVLSSVVLNAQNTIEKLSDGQSFGFLEGPVWDGNENLYFTDIPNSDIWKYNTTTSAFTKIVDGTSNGSNGLMFNKVGNLIVCEGSAGRIVERNVSSGAIDILASGFNGTRFNTTNDLCIGINGGVYFTDPATKKNTHQPNKSVYYLSPAGSVSEIITDMTQPNGIIISPDGKTLYVNDASKTVIHSYTIDIDGSVSNKKDFAFVDPTNQNSDRSGADGMAVDVNGNVYVASSKGVFVFDKNGTRLNVINVPEIPSNCTFGGPNNQTLFITARKNLYSIVLNQEGFRHPFDYPETDGPLCKKVLDVDFNNRTGNLSNYTLAKAQVDFGGLDLRSSNEILGLDYPNNNNWRANNRAGNGILEAHYPKGQTGDVNSGFSFDKRIPDTEEAILEYKLYYQGGGTSNKFVLVDGGIMPGLGGSSNETGIPVSCTENTENLEDGFSCRLVWRKGRYINVQLKVPDLDGSNDCDREHRFHRMNSNVWYTYRQYIKLNTPGQSDGVLEMFVNGESTFKRTNVMFRKAGRDDIKINDVLFHTFRIGGTSVHNDEILFDDIKVWVACNDDVVQEPYDAVPIVIPGTVEAENYDKGGEGISYNDSNSQNSGNSYRLTEGVDVVELNPGHAVGYTSQGEWLEYTVDIEEAGEYNVALLYSSNSNGGKLGLELDGNSLVSNISKSSTGAWDNYQTLNRSVVLPEGKHVLRVNIEAGGFNLDQLVFEKSLVSSVSDFKNNDRIYVFPNPSRDGLFELNRATEWVVTSTQGRVVANGTDKQIDLSGLSKGVYILNTSGTKTKLVVE